MDTVQSGVVQFMKMLEQSGGMAYILYVILSMFGWLARLVAGVDKDSNWMKAVFNMAFVAVPLGLLAGTTLEGLDVTKYVSGLPYIGAYVAGTIGNNIMVYLWGVNIGKIMKRYKK